MDKFIVFGTDRHVMVMTFCSTGCLCNYATNCLEMVILQDIDFEMVNYAPELLQTT